MTWQGIHITQDVEQKRPGWTVTATSTPQKSEHAYKDIINDIDNKISEATIPIQELHKIIVKPRTRYWS